MVMAARNIEVVPVAVLRDNYVWLLHDPASGETAAVDPSVADPVLGAAEAHGTPITQVLNTHWHPDHTGGNDSIREATGCRITGPAEAEKVSRMDRVVAEGDRVAVGSLEAEIWDIPAHTAGHIAYYFRDAGLVFVGDTLFAMGCGRLFEGTAEQMFANLRRLASLPEDVRVYCGHEYTLANARFAVTVEPGNQALAQRLKAVEQARADGRVTLPTTIGEERATNPFMRAGDAEEFARLRQMKDSFG
jgi:hydroxyacylglutathione hydrolase